ncbi:ATP-dependent DNA helicase II subunit 1 [Coccidioides immitis RS]|uniref:ATP-dependent DNA helicase II subunit 1 n=2 Tax=Coccidioides immitis TaxID=5501 RepID=KU70_COCIM|nr:ATP-dependent DNA helicase II subunit 1 [Coccidioides immitis RS]Q1DU75.2 RecName: Full=ATP-dependent DNA helicase II subunit 1; AltName: Full=ATP-dependent DNA helicase II subunit Ku70 [Coccidioides immitis RS]EAS30659.3 ATP-dependent DNA helicase II subunit 1 [Coccidioides immitis RS]
MAESEYNREDDSFEEEEEVDDSGYKSVKDAVLFAIEVSESMLTAAPNPTSKKARPESPATAALKCAYHLMQQRIISNPKDMIGVLLYGTESSKFYDDDEDGRGSLPYPHCYLFTDLDVPAASDVKELHALVEDEDRAAEILVPSKEPVSMANVLFCANQIFTTKAPNFSSRRLFIVTDNDNPHSKDKVLKSAATVRAKDLYDLGVVIELFPISTPDHDFDTSKFYDDMIYRASPTDPEAPNYSCTSTKTSGADGISILNSLLSSINSKSVPRRALFSNLPLELGPEFRISVSGFLIFKRQAPARSCYVWLGGEQPQIVKGVTTLVADDSAREVEKWEIRKAYKFGGEHVAFTQEEQSALRNFGDPVIRIIGFKPMSSLPIWASTKHSTFIYPSEAGFVGSTRVFSALQQTLLKQKKFALVWFVARKNAAPVMAALIPGEEKLDDNDAQVIPPGMWIQPLPFADDIRQNPETHNIVAPEPLIDKMREIIQVLQLPKGRYDPQRYPNPSLQWHYRILQALALDEDLPDQAEDKTIPKYKQIDKRAGEHVLEWGEELETQNRLLENSKPITSTLAKRPAPSRKAEGDERATKRVRAESTGDAEVKMHYEKGSLNKLTVTILKDFLLSHNLSGTGKKADLIDRVEEFFDRK